MASSKKRANKDPPVVECNFRQLSDVLLKDPDDKIKRSGKWPMLIDPSGQAATFLKYRESNYICAVDSSQMQPEVLRMALLGSIRYGKIMVVDMLEADMSDVIESKLNEIKPNLMQDIMKKDLLQGEKYMELVRPGDDSAYQGSEFMHQFADSFLFVIVTQQETPAEKLLRLTYPIRVIMPA